VSSTHTEHDHHHGGPGHSHSHDEGGHRHGSALAQPEVPISEGAASAAVAIDIGHGLGALVILPGERFRGREISRVDSDEPRTHTGVHERSKKGGKVLTAIFGSLPAGEYVIWEDALTAGPVVEIPDGAVAQVKLP
jgi:hypothetical protein